MGRTKSSLFGLALLSAWAAFVAPAAGAERASPGSAVDYTAVATFTSDYVYRGVSQSAGNPALQGYVEARHKLFYAGFWASNVDFGKERNRAGILQDVAHVEIGPYAGIRPEWKGINFDLGVFYYAYPDSLPAADLGYVEFDAVATYAVTDRLNLRGMVWWSPDESDNNSRLSGIEFSTSYDLKQVWFVSPTVSVLYGSQWGGGNDETYAYWNAGLTLAMSSHPVLSFDIRYWDTDLKDCIDASAYQCGTRVVGSLTATF